MCKWISVKDSVPDDYRTVIVLVSQGVGSKRYLTRHFGSRDRDENRWWEKREIALADDLTIDWGCPNCKYYWPEGEDFIVTHWCELPEFEIASMEVACS